MSVEGQATSDHKMRAGVWLPFGLLCVLSGSRWVLDAGWNRTTSTLQSGAWGCAVLAVLAGLAAVARRRALPGLRSVFALLAVGGGLLAAPALGAVLHGPAAESLNRAVALCFVPVIAAVLTGIRGERENLWPALLGLGGALLVFPLALPSSALAYVGLLATPLAVAAACVACGQVRRGVAAEWSAAALFAGGAIVLVVLRAVVVATSGEVSEAVSASAVAIDAVLAGLLVLAVMRLEAMRFVSSYFAIPMLAVVEGVAIFRSGLTFRLGCGVLLLAIGLVGLLKKQVTDDGTSLLRLN
jgi:hypothetical protein